MRRFIFLRSAVAILLMTSCGDNLGHVVVGSGTRYIDNVGGPQTVTLPDGSHVLLMDGTAITVSKGFGTEDREVEIDGQGMFFVKTPGGKPFVVHTGNLVMEVLDTIGADGSGAGDGGWIARFAVDAVRKQAGEETDVLHGRLRVTKSYHSDTDSLPEELTAGDMVMINREIDLMEKEKMSGPEEDKVKAKFHLAPL